MYLLAHFIVQNKKPWDQIQGYEDLPFLGRNDQIAPNKIFFRKTLISMSYLAPFIVENWKAILTVDPELRGRAILGPKWPICPKQEFFWKSH